MGRALKIQKFGVNNGITINANGTINQPALSTAVDLGYPNFASLTNPVYDDPNTLTPTNFLGVVGGPPAISSPSTTYPEISPTVNIVPNSRITVLTQGSHDANQQYTKIFSGSTENSNFVDFGLDSEPLDSFGLDNEVVNKIYENIDKFYCYTLDHHGLFLDDMNKALQDQFNFTTFKNLDKANTSPDTGVVFTKKHIDRIIELNQIDMQVYEYVQKIKKRY